MVFSTDSDLSYIYLQYKSKKSYGLFGLGWKNQEHTVLLDSRVISELSLLMAKLIEQKHQVALKARPMIWHSTSLTFQKKSPVQRMMTLLSVYKASKATKSKIVNSSRKDNWNSNFDFDLEFLEANHF